MRTVRLCIALVCAFGSLVAIAEEPPAKTSSYEAELAKKLGADERGMKTYVLCILKTGPRDAEIKGKERDEIFAGHFANIGRLADEGGSSPSPVRSERTTAPGAGSTSSTCRRSKRRRSSSFSTPL